jgi:r-opsin
LQIVKAVVMHEAALKAQAKKMNVDSLRSNADDGKESAEIRIAKVGLEIPKNMVSLPWHVL